MIMGLKSIDRIGIWLSTACMVHCILTPILLLALPMLSASLVGATVHKILAIVLPLVAILAFIPGYRHHRDKLVMLFGALGISTICLSAFYHWEQNYFLLEILVTGIGSSSLIVAHLRNRKLCDCANH